mgnify:CR=1 FL=1
MDVQIKRIYTLPEDHDGYRVLVDRIWPRGMSKTKIVMDAWWKELAPSHDLRKWFNHDVNRWPEFQIQYMKELNANNLLFQARIKECEKISKITLLYSAKDELHNQAIVLKAVLMLS